MKRIEDSLETSETISNAPTYLDPRRIGVLEEEEKKKGYDKIFEEIIVKIYQHRGRGWEDLGEWH